MKDILTVQQHFVEQQRSFPQATGDLTGLLWDLSIAVKIISREVNKAGLVDILGIEGMKNASGDQVAKLDRFAQETLVSMLTRDGHICCLASEEADEIIQVPADHPKGKYVVVFDPLDGSSNIEANVPIGTIFGIFRRKSAAGEGKPEDVLQPGTALVAAGYVVYGSSTMLVYSTWRGVHGFTLDPSVGEFLLSHPDIKIPARGKIYSVNEGHASHWPEATRRYIAHLKSPEGGPYSSRYVGSLVADAHRTLLYGGIFLYPQEKLRLLYEAAPMAMLMEQAGGMATTGTERILSLTPRKLHQKVPLVIGSPENVLEYQRFLAEHDAVQPGGIRAVA